MKFYSLLFLLMLSVGCGSATDDGQPRTTDVHAKRFVVDHVSQAPLNSGLVTIELIRDTQVGYCFMVVRSHEGLVMTNAQCMSNRVER